MKQPTKRKNWDAEEDTKSEIKKSELDSDELSPSESDDPSDDSDKKPTTTR